MKKGTKIVLAVAIIAVVGLIFFSYSGDSTPGQYDAFAQCLNEKGIVMYGAYWCPHCQNQKDMFGKSVEYINYVECDPRGNDANPELCQAKGVNSYPTWEFPNGEIVSGEMSLREISFRSECELPS